MAATQDLADQIIEQLTWIGQAYNQGIDELSDRDGGDQRHMRP